MGKHPMAATGKSLPLGRKFVGKNKSAPAHYARTLAEHDGANRPTRSILSGGPGSVYSSSASPPLLSAILDG